MLYCNYCWFCNFCQYDFKIVFPHPLYSDLGLFLNLITVNCIILGRAEVFASKNNVISSIFDGFGMGIGFTLALLIIGSVREIIGSGQWFGIELPRRMREPMTTFIMPAGGFFTLGIVIAVVGKITKKPIREFGCNGCPRKKIYVKVGDCDKSIESGVK